ncbi:MAG: site-2 protease family protein [Candidatus Woesearchaeota archaeon]
MSFLNNFYSILNEYKFVILFYSILLFIIYLNRKKLKEEAPFIYLYRTKFGITFMKKTSEKFRNIIKILGYIGIIFAYLGIIIVSVLLVKNAYEIIIQKPGAIGGSPVIPGLPIAGLGITFPLVIGWISLFIIMIVHEFSHGIVAKAHNVKIKNSGIAFFGPILGAFVEPDEKDLKKQPDEVQLSIFSAGPISNVVLWIICIIILIGLSNVVLSMTYSDGVKIGIIKNETLPAYSSGIKDNSIIIKINEYNIKNRTDLEFALENLKPNQETNILIKEIDENKKEIKKEYKIIPTIHPKNETKAYLGILILEEQRTLKNNNQFNNIIYKILLWFYELFSWTSFISINIGLINLFPIFITDGAQMLRKNFETLFKNNKEKGLLIWKNINLMGLIIIGILILYNPLRNLFNIIINIIF